MIVITRTINFLTRRNVANHYKVATCLVYTSSQRNRKFFISSEHCLKEFTESIARVFAGS